ncbi:polyhomeotic-like protein 2 isoform X1 [Pangasianodon hypophthalmus]|uniref:polyhomeotic-like protein 2 isoform X1 n=2 Tax=Pangasianodon hypophthalmus TaxID=310915 RepID=UPI002307FFF9|nr:polyhomeotic-like protein 2 isoform X1 [Pangasianodon hypophthalmus]
MLAFGMLIHAEFFSLLLSSSSLPGVVCPAGQSRTQKWCRISGKERDTEAREEDKVYVEGVVQRSSSRGSSPGGRRAAMERAQASVSSGSSAPAPSNPIITSSSNSNSQGMTSVSSSVSSSVSASSRQQTLPQISVYGGIPDRQTVQVIQQALHRQPSTAAQYLQQMYAAQQQHLMLQTAALQQQHLSLAAVQQASIVAGRQNCSQSGAASQQALSSQTTIKLASSPAAAAQLISRAQGVNPSPVSITQQAVLLGNSSTPTLTASQAQMYLRAQMAQQNSLVQVARSLGRAVPLSPQLILTPTATVTAVQPEASSQSVNLQSTSPQMQNLVLCSQQGAVASSSSTPQPQLHGLSVKQSSGGATQMALPSLPVPQLKSPSSQALGQQGVKTSLADASSEPVKTSDGVSEMSARVISVSHNMGTATNHPLINTAYAQIQTHQLLQQHKQQFVIQQQSQVSQPSVQPQGQAAQPVAIQPALAGQPCAIPVLPKPPAQQAAIFHSTVSPRMLNGQSPLLNPSKVKQVQLTAVNLHFQAPPTQVRQTAVTQDNADKGNAVPPAIRDDCLGQSGQQMLTQPTQEPARTEQCLYDHNQLTVNAEGPDTAVPVPAAALVCVNGNPAMTSGSGNNAPTVTGSTPHNGHSKTPQAIVKPQILTHVIEGFVIQEGAEPFPVERPSLLLENVKKHKQQQSHSDMEKKVQDSHTADSEMEDLSQQELKNREKEPTLSCELCGKVDFAYNFKRSKRFCSTVCAKRYNVGCTKRMGLFPRRPTPENPKKQRASSNHHHNTSSEAKKQNPSSQTGAVGSGPSPRLSQLGHGESSQCSDMSSYEEPPSPVSIASSGARRLRKERGGDHGENHSRELPLLTQHFMPSDPAKWNVEDVYEFICSLPGCQEIAEEFRAQEIDGQALLLLKEDHLMSTMNIKLGPALKIFARISMLKDS